jgi:hypothetical protein
MQSPTGLHASPAGQVPQLPPQLSSPQSLPWHRGEQVGWHCPFWQEVSAPGQFTHAAPPVPQVFSVFPGWHCPLALQHPLAQVAGEQVGCPWHWPLAEQVWPELQLPQPFSLLPQPSGPHWRPLQFGAQHRPAALHWLAGG